MSFNSKEEWVSPGLSMVLATEELALHGGQVGFFARPQATVKLSSPDVSQERDERIPAMIPPLPSILTHSA
jgi:hypothetical protein